MRKEVCIALCPVIDIVSQGNTFEEAKVNLQEAVNLYIKSFGIEDVPILKSEPVLTTLEVVLVK
jgi:predicted RNase H-like HicB family nuclease